MKDGNETPRRKRMGYLKDHNKEQAMRNNREKKLEKQLTNLQNHIQKGRENNPVKIEQRIGRIKERFDKVSQYYAITYTRQDIRKTAEQNQEPGYSKLSALSRCKNMIGAVSSMI